MTPSNVLTFAWEEEEKGEKGAEKLFEENKAIYDKPTAIILNSES